MRQDVVALTKLLIGAPDDPDKPGLMERVRLVESRHRGEKWALMIVIGLVISDIVVRGIAWYRGAP